MGESTVRLSSAKGVESPATEKSHLEDAVRSKPRLSPDVLDAESNLLNEEPEVIDVDSEENDAELNSSQKAFRSHVQSHPAPSTYSGPSLAELLHQIDMAEYEDKLGNPSHPLRQPRSSAMRVM